MIEKIIIGILIGICIFLGISNDHRTEYKTLYSKSDTTYVIKKDSIYLNHFKYVSIPSKPFVGRIDTNEIIKSYLSLKSVSDTFKFKNATVIVKDTLSGDSIIGQDVSLLDSSLIIRDSIFIMKQPKLDIYGIINYNPITKIPGIGVELNYKRFIGGISTNGLNIGYKLNK